MSQENSYFKLGLFVLIGLALFVAGVFVFGAGKLFQKRIPVETAITESVIGLDVGAEVRYHGVLIGSVSSIQLGAAKARAEEEYSKRLALGKLIIVGFTLNAKTLPPLIAKAPRENIEQAVQAGLRARLSSSGITGPTYLELLVEDKPDPDELVRPYQTDTIYIPSTLSFTGQLKSQLETFLEHVNEMKLVETVDSARGLIEDLRKSVHDVKIKEMNDSVLATLKKAEESANEVTTLLKGPEIKATFKNVEQTTANARDITASPEIQKVLADLPKISENLKTATEQIRQITENPAINKTLDATGNLGPAVTDLRRALRELNDILTSNRTDLDVMLTNLRRTSVNAAEVTDDAKGNPARVLFGNPPPKREAR